MEVSLSFPVFLISFFPPLCISMSSKLHFEFSEEAAVEVSPSFSFFVFLFFPFFFRCVFICLRNGMLNYLRKPLWKRVFPSLFFFFSFFLFFHVVYFYVFEMGCRIV